MNTQQLQNFGNFTQRQEALVIDKAGTECEVLYPKQMARFTALSQEYLAQIDQEISRLQQLREQIAATLEAEAQVNTNRKRSVAPKRRLSRGGPSAAGRLAIAEAQRKRWAAKKAADKKLTKRTSGKKAGAKRTAKAPAAKSAE